ncbi:hypothetical protein DFS34DRAFT_607835 [Phlyctochytrium arcticum]|nr:hypothetical protein DFS34DRAFT_607835 [Phlyctochytrium arcticum]
MASRSIRILTRQNHLLKTPRLLPLTRPIPQRHYHHHHHSTTSSQSHPFTAFKPISDLTPTFAVNGDTVHILDEPKEFYNALIEGIRTAKHRITLASLYLGSSEHALISALHSSLSTNPELKLTVLLDYFRGTRGDPNSLTLLAPLIAEFGDRVSVSLYHSPAVSEWTKSVVPQRFIEGFGLQHMKIYVFDDEVILSGANLNKDYFTNRQDRYMKFTQSAPLSDYYHSLVQTISQFSYKVKCGPGIIQLLPPRTLPTSPNFKSEARESLHAFSQSWVSSTHHLQKQQQSKGEDTLILPMIQAGQLGIHQESQILSRLLQNPTSSSSTYGPDKQWLVSLSSGYLNFPQFLLDLITTSTAEYQILTAAPEANGFYRSAGVSRYLPGAYTYLEQLLIRYAGRKAQDGGVKVLEWKREQWTFHAKGIWMTPLGESTPVATLIGSSNYGYRSMYRDLEAQSLVITSNPSLRDRLQTNLEYLFSYASVVDMTDLTTGERSVPMGVKLATRLIRSML